MSSKAPNAGSKPLHGERDLIDRGLLVGGWSRRRGGERLSMDSDCVGCGPQLGGQGEDWRLHSTRLHFLCARRH